MPRRLTSLHARTICHATEDPAKVELALRAVVGDSPIERSSTEGHFGNSIEVLESTVKDEAHMLGLLRRMTEKDLGEVASTLDMRMDDACFIFLRLDKQRAYGGELGLSEGEDVIAVRIKVRAYPAKREIASEIVKGVLDEVVSNRGAEADRAG